MKSRTTKTPETPTATTVEAPKVKAPKPKAPKKAIKPPAPDPLAGVRIRAEVLTYKPDLHRARIHIKTPELTYYKLVPGIRTTTKAEALAKAQEYRESILASSVLPPRADRLAK